MAAKYGNRAALGLAAGLVLTGGAHAADPVAPPPSAQTIAARQIEATEQAFAQAVSQAGIGPGFRRYAAPGAVMFLPDPVPAAPYLQNTHAAGELAWRPQVIGAAPSGDLAFSLGPSVYRPVAAKAEGGVYLTIWKRGADGGWQFILERSAAAPATVLDGAALPPVLLLSDPAAKPDLSQGLREADAGLDTDLSKDTPEAFASRLDDQAIVVRADRPVAAGRRRALRLLAETPVMEARLLSGGVSTDGVLGYTYGKARWTAATGPQQGFYVRVWRNAGLGWRLLVDQLAER